ncbi:MAG: adenosylcobinamide-phosphate synthase CbiB [Deltaproteobacteria bacterium]|nr:adenosylcobinamide-phosphate synthase CbiB [Deltaproteobacteria bacterium]
MAGGTRAHIFPKGPACLALAISPEGQRRRPGPGAEPQVPILLTLAALALDSRIGDPQGWPHPVRLIGRLITLLERLCRQAMALLGPGQWPQLLLGAAMGLVVVASSALAVWLALLVLGRVSPFLWFPAVLYLTFTAFCLKDLVDHVGRVEGALAGGDLGEARRALSMIVGRDTGGLSAEGVRRASVETVAENFSDGLVAPLLFLALGGPVLAWAYKAANTLDSMVGYRDERYLFLGRFSARLDDLLNLVPSRLAALLLVAGARLSRLDAAGAFRLWRREGSFHSSPNSGQTEAAMAGALGVRLGGPSWYGGQMVEKPFIGQGNAEASALSVRDALRLVRTSTLLALGLAIALEAAVMSIFPLPFGWGLVF